MLSVTNVVKSFKKIKVLEIDSLELQKGEIAALLGNNGAGKTTLIKSIADLIKIDDGEICIDQNKVDETETWKDITALYLTEKMLIPYLKPIEYLEFIGKIKKVSKKKVFHFIEQHKEFYKDELFNDRKLIRQLSLGNQQKVGLLATFLGQNKLIILDEPYTNLDISSKKYLSMMIENYNQTHNITFLISSHNMNEVLTVSSRVIILKKGIIINDSQIANISTEDIELQLSS